ncbi:FIP1[V]-like protein isoform X1 [Brassica rapa]|uniref:Pre-mRNA polyadenylation factor Fip1 domain-containing protein n=1 Tax=Brassica campestris TaxID=3711 RepID=M4CRE5_BRACM|nr:FIP1[V]-like protein isoform X1 [Brassica rapa]
MDEDDEFGDLYSDVLPPFQPPPPPPLRSIDLNLRLHEQDAAEPNSPSVAKVPDTTASKPSTTPSHDAIGDDKDMNFDIEEPDADSTPAIPGLATDQGTAQVGEGGYRGQGDDWDSDSEDDLQIVLNDNVADRRARMGDNEDDDEEPLVIVTDADPNQHMEEQQLWGEEAVEGESKEGGEAVKGSAAGPTKAGYNSHGYHHPFHSQFKYIRPGAAPVSGSVASAAGQVRPPANLGPMAGRGRGDWRPMGVRNASAAQKGYHQTWGGNTAGRGLDFTLPSHKTIFEFDVDAFEEKPWRYQGVDITDYFNFGLNEESWKDYCKQLDQHRIETTMKSRIRVYESGRTDQSYDPDLPPELAAATGAQVVPVDSSNLVKLDTAQGDSANIRPPLPPGRPIPVETGSVERPSSIDTRAPRMRDLEAIIEIVCEDSHEDEPSGEKGAEQADSGQTFRSSSPVGDRGTRSSTVDREDVGGEAGKDAEIEEEQKMSSAVPRSAVEKDDGGESKTERSSESSKARSGSHRDHQQLKDSAEEEVIQDRNHCTRPASNKKHHVNNAQHQSRKYQDIGKEMERTRAGSKGESGKDFDKRKERDVDGGVWRRKEDDTFSRRGGDEGSRKRDRGDDHVPSRNHVDDGGLRNNYELDYHISKRRKVEEYVRRTRSEKNEISFGQREESISRLRRERGDRLDYQKRDVQHKIRDDIYDQASLRHRDDIYMQRDGNERLRERGDLDKLKLTHEDGLSARGRERQVAARGHRGSEDRSSSRMKDEYKEHLTKDTTRQTKQTKRKEHPGEESSSYHRGREDDIVSNEKKQRLERTSAKTDKVVDSLDGQRLQDRKHKDSRRKIKEQREDTDSSRIKQGEQNGSSQVTGLKRTNEARNYRSEISQQHNATKRHKEDTSSGDELQDSKRGRTKLERWGSHKERDDDITAKGYSSTSKIQEKEKGTNGRASEPNLGSIGKNRNVTEEKSGHDLAETKDGSEKGLGDRHLDMIVKFKKRSERFKLPMPTEKDNKAGVKKMESEMLPSAKIEGPADSEVKAERPSRKRRWTSS